MTINMKIDLTTFTLNVIKQTCTPGSSSLHVSIVCNDHDVVGTSSYSSVLDT